VNIYPALRYRDARSAIDWLCEAFGFEERAVHAADDGGIAHAELMLGTGMVMLGSAGAGVPPVQPVHGDPVDFSALPFTIYVAIEDVDRHHDHARAAGARIVRDLEDTDYGSREYSALDPEGNVWSFGTYHPAAAE